METIDRTSRQGAGRRFSAACSRPRGGATNPRVPSRRAPPWLVASRRTYRIARAPIDGEAYSVASSDRNRRVHATQE